MYAARMVGLQGDAPNHARSNLDIVRSAQLGDRDSFVRMITAYDAAVFRLGWNFTQSATAATEIYETVFTTAYRLLPSYAEGDSFLIWLFRIATRSCLAHSAVAQRGRGAKALVPGEGPDDARIPSRLRQAMLQLTARDRLVFILRHELQFKAATIARILDADEHSIHAALNRAFCTLRIAAQGIGIRQ
jgi:RNA polymerase sigma factor (sigma-70 family)